MDKELRSKIEGIVARMDRAGSVHEAEACAAALQRVMLRHNLTQADIDAASGIMHEEYISKFVQLGEARTPGLQWRINLAYVMAEMNFCVFIRCGVHGGVGWFVGQASNIDAVEVMFKATAETSDRLAPTEWAEFQNSSEFYTYGRPKARAWKNSFQIGFVTGIRMKMRSEREKMAQELEAGVVSALVVVKDAELEQAVNEKLGKTTTHKGSAPTSASGFQRGVQRGLEHSFRDELSA
jgi:hypothetical protein